MPVRKSALANSHVAARKSAPTSIHTPPFIACCAFQHSNSHVTVHSMLSLQHDAIVHTPILLTVDISRQVLAARRSCFGNVAWPRFMQTASGGGIPHASQCTSHTLVSELCGLTSAEPVYRSTAAVVPGRLYLWEQRRFLAYMGVKDGRVFRKMETDKGRWQELAEEWRFDVA